MRAAPLANAVPAALLLLALLALSGCAGSSGPRPDALAGPQEIMADAQLRSGRPDLALWAYDRALKAEPGQPHLTLKRARALLRTGRGAEALLGVEATLAGLPDNSPLLPAALQLRGETLVFLGRAREALEPLERSAALEQDSWRARCLLGMALQSLGRHQEAAEQYRAALGSPRLARLPEERGRMVREELANNLGVALVLSGDLEGGAAVFGKARDRGLGSERVCNNLGLLLVRLHRPAEALEAFRAGGDEARALNNLGWAFLLQGERAKARTLFEKALEAAPDYYEAAGENLRRTMLADGRERPAREAFVGAAGVSITVPSRDLGLSLLAPER